MILTAAQLEQFRADTPGVDNRIHFNNAGAALMPSSVLQAMQHHLTLEANIGGYEAHAAERDRVAAFYDRTAKLINARRDNIAYTSSATDAYTRALSAIPLQSGDTILTSTNDYASNFIAFFALRKRIGIKIELLSNLPSGEINVNDVAPKLRKYQPKILAITHVPTNSGLVQPVEEIGQIVKNFDAIYLVDGCQSIGQRRVDVGKIHCDFLSATFRKFLRGPRGAGFLYVSDRVLESAMAPLALDMKGADWSSTYDYTLRSDAQRFEEWEKPYALLLGASEAVQYLLDVGIQGISERAVYLAQQLRDGLAHMPSLQLLDQGTEKAALVTFHDLNLAPAVIKDQLSQHNTNSSIGDLSSAYMDYQHKNVTGAVRLSPHYYNSEAEVQKVLEVLEHIVT